jgi:hypothetical protein
MEDLNYYIDTVFGSNQFNWSHLWCNYHLISNELLGKW